MSNTMLVAVDISFEPVAGEGDDLASIALANDLRSQLYTKLSAQPDMLVHSLPTTGRSGDLIELARHLAQAVYDQRAELTALIGTAITVITALGAQRRVAEIELTDGDRKLIVKGSDIDRAQQLIREFLPDRSNPEPGKKPRVTVRTRKGRG